MGQFVTDLHMRGCLDFRSPSIGPRFCAVSRFPRHWSAAAIPDGLTVRRQQSRRRARGLATEPWEDRRGSSAPADDPGWLRTLQLFDRPSDAGDKPTRRAGYLKAGEIALEDRGAAVEPTFGILYLLKYQFNPRIAVLVCGEILGGIERLQFCRIPYFSSIGERALN